MQGVGSTLPTAPTLRKRAVVGVVVVVEQWSRTRPTQVQCCLRRRQQPSWQQDHQQQQPQLQRRALTTG